MELRLEKVELVFFYDRCKSNFSSLALPLARPQHAHNLRCSRQAVVVDSADDIGDVRPDHLETWAPGFQSSTLK